MREAIDTIRLDKEGIARASEAARELLDERHKDKRQATAAWLVFENNLLKLQEHFGEDTEAQVITTNVLGRYRLLVRVRGERFDPRDDNTCDEWEYSAYEASGMAPGYSYLGGYNIIALTEARKPLGSLARILLALVLGIVVSVAGSAFLPQETRVTLLDSVVQPTFELLVNMLAGLAGPLVFFSMAWGICGMGDAASIGRKGTALIRCFFGMNARAVAIATLACMLLFGWGTSASSSSGGLLVNLYEMLIALVPTNLLEPFVNENMPQIVLLAVAAGVSILVIGESVDGMRSIVRQGNALIQFLMEQLCRLVPLIIFAMTISQIWSGTFTKLFDSWVLVLVAVVLMYAVLLIEAVMTSMRTGIALPKLLRMCMPVVLVGLTTASSTAAMRDELAVCTEEMGIDEGQASFGVPLAMVLCKPSTALEIAVLMAFAMHTFGTGGDILWYVRLALAACMYAIVVPPIPGGMIACFSMMFSELGIPTEAMALVTALDVILDYPVTGVTVGSHVLAIARASLGKDSAK